MQQKMSFKSFTSTFFLHSDYFSYKKYKNNKKCKRKSSHHMLACTTALSLIVIIGWMPDFIVALKDVSVTIPQAVKRGSNAMLTCNYDMENDTLYSVKWYKGRREFYRYTPKENPAMKVFLQQSGLNVERNLSNQSHVVLLAVSQNISGKFTCEISVEAPSFQTAMVSGEMEVVELPEEQATVTGIQPRYRIGDLVDGNCSIKYSKPAANLTWTINGIVVPPHHIKTYQIEKYEEANLESVMSAIHFMVTTQHFIKGQMRLKCTASIFDIFKEEIESVIEEDRPRIMASGRSIEYGVGGNGYEDHNESFLTYMSAPKSSASCITENLIMNIFKSIHHYLYKSSLITGKLATATKAIMARLLYKKIALTTFVNEMIADYEWHSVVAKLINVMNSALMTTCCKAVMQLITIMAIFLRSFHYLIISKSLTNKQKLKRKILKKCNCIEMIMMLPLMMIMMAGKYHQDYFHRSAFTTFAINEQSFLITFTKSIKNNIKRISSNQNNVKEKIQSSLATNNEMIQTTATSLNRCETLATKFHVSPTFATNLLLPFSLHSPRFIEIASHCHAFYKLFTACCCCCCNSSSGCSQMYAFDISETDSSSVSGSCSSNGDVAFVFDSFPLCALDSKSNNAKYMSKDQTLLMTSAAATITTTAKTAIATALRRRSTAKTLTKQTRKGIVAVILHDNKKLSATSALSSSHSFSVCPSSSYCLSCLAIYSALASKLQAYSTPSMFHKRLMASIEEVLLHQC